MGTRYDFLLQQKKLPLDFISTHSYGVKQGYLDEYGNSGTILSKDPMSVSGDVLNSRKQIAESSMPNLELHYTEWSASYTPADPIHDSYHEAAYILEKLKQCGDAVNSMSYWVFTDIFEEAGPRFLHSMAVLGYLQSRESINQLFMLIII
jgi:xylan 1,4-beta-xylosidase